MAKRLTRLLPRLAERIVVRHHPVAADSIPHRPKDLVVLCPVLFSPCKGMTERIIELVSALDGVAEPDIRLQVTASKPEVPEHLVSHPRINIVGRIDHRALRELWAPGAIYFPPGIESFGYR